MKRIYSILLLAIMALPMMGQGINQAKAEAEVFSFMRDYKYVIVAPVGETLSTSSGYSVALTSDVAVGKSVTSSSTVSDYIAGLAINKGYIRLMEATPEQADKTMLIIYTTTGRSNEGFGVTRISGRLQVMNARTNELVCSIRMSSKGLSAEDALVKTIDLGMQKLFQVCRAATADELENLSTALGISPVRPVEWPEMTFVSYELIQRVYSQNVEMVALSDTFRTAYAEVMVYFYRHPSIEIGNKIKAVNLFASKMKQDRDAAKIDKKLLKLNTVEEKLDYLYTMSCRK